MNNIHMLSAFMAGMGAVGNRKSITDGNRRHTERSRPGSQEEIDRMAAAQAKRDRKNAKCASAPPKEGKQ